jgi:hypothetical protein
VEEVVATNRNTVILDQEDQVEELQDGSTLVELEEQEIHHQ